jgi:heme/copper-type cytochrome/quinol oxidase subunit 2
MMKRNWKWIYWLLMALAAGMIAFAPIPFISSVSLPTSRTFKVEASQFAYTPSELHVDAGDTVTIQLISTNVAHGLYVDGYDISIEADPGQPAALTFAADKPGSFRFRCNLACGAMHPFMIGKLTVGADNWFFRSFGLALLGAVGVIMFVKSNTSNTIDL